VGFRTALPTRIERVSRPPRGVKKHARRPVRHQRRGQAIAHGWDATYARTRSPPGTRPGPRRRDRHLSRSPFATIRSVGRRLCRRPVLNQGGRSTAAGKFSRMPRRRFILTATGTYGNFDQTITPWLSREPWCQARHLPGMQRPNTYHETASWQPDHDRARLAADGQQRRKSTARGRCATAITTPRPASRRTSAITYEATSMNAFDTVQAEPRSRARARAPESLHLRADAP